MRKTNPASNETNWEQEWMERQRERNRNLSALNQISNRKYDGGGVKRSPLPCDYNNPFRDQED